MKIFCRKGGRTDRLSSFPSTLFLLAPAWGATFPQQLGDHRGADFYSRPRVGGRPASTPSMENLSAVFLLTPRVGGDRSPYSVWSNRSYFYSRPPRGGRHQAENIFRTNSQSLLTPPRGGRRAAARSKALTFSQFLLTPPRGGRPATVAWSTAMCYFYSRPRMGGDVFDPDTGQRQLEFLLTPQNRGRTHRRGTPQAETGV